MARAWRCPGLTPVTSNHRGSCNGITYRGSTRWFRLGHHAYFSSPSFAPDWPERLRGIARPTSLGPAIGRAGSAGKRRLEEHTSELQALMRISYAVFWLT